MDRRAYHTLDALRGVAALLVVTRHSSGLLGTLNLGESYLAVDLFFVMSGVVIAHSYEERLRSGASPVRFFILRLIRLYPLYLLGVVLGAACLFAGAPTPRDLGSDVAGVVLATLMLPAMAFPSVDGPRWSLVFEVGINLLYGLAVRRLGNRVLVAVVLAAMVGLVQQRVAHHTFDFGYQPGTFLGGCLRVTFSFGLGVLIRRLQPPHTKSAPVAAWLCVVAAAALLATPVAHGIRAPYEAAVVFLGFPLLVSTAMRFNVGGWTARLFSFLGVTSYGIYILHAPLAQILASALSRAGLGATSGWACAATGAGLMVGVVVIAATADAVYDRPVRSWLQARFGPLTPRSAPPRRDGSVATPA